MEWLNKIPNWIKIPIKVLLPALTIFSALLLFLGDSAIEILHMSKFREESGFAFGLLFIITLSLELVYVAYFIYDKYKAHSIARRVANILLKGNQVELMLLIALYNEPKKSAMFPMNDGMIARLEGKRYISKFQQTVDYTYRITYFIQPFVECAIDYIFNKLDKEEGKLKNKIRKSKDNTIMVQLQDNLNKLKLFVEDAKKESISNYYDQKQVF